MIPADDDGDDDFPQEMVCTIMMMVTTMTGDDDGDDDFPQDMVCAIMMMVTTMTGDDDGDGEGRGGLLLK